MKRQQGMALITVLMVVAIVTVVTAGMIVRQQISIRNIANQIVARQIWHYALGGEALAASILREAAKPTSDSPSPVDHLQQAWARPIAVFEIDQGRIAVSIEDLNGRLNLNDLSTRQVSAPWAKVRFERLLMKLDISPHFMQNLIEWLAEPQQMPSTFTPPNDPYLGLEPPYRATHRFFRDVSELRLVLGLSEAQYLRLRPHVSALPPGTPLNINSASALLLSTLSDELTATQLDALIRDRGQNGYSSVVDFFAHPALEGLLLEKQGLAVRSKYFEVRSDVQLEQRRRVLVSILQRQPDGRIGVLQRDLGQPSTLALEALMNEKPL